jgi:putative FmdB family regulatory protein
MPIYEYKCENGHVFDVMQKMSEDPLSTCVQCGAPVKKVLHPVGISFKGSGFYSTDYSSKATKSESSSNGDSKSSDNGDSKTETTKTDASNKSGKKP